MENVVGEDEVSTKTAPLEREKDSVDEVVLHTGVPSCLWPYESPGAVCAPSRRCLVDGTVAALVGRTPGLVSPKPGTEVERSLVSEPQTHGEAKTGYAEHDLPPAGSGVMS